MEKNTLIEKTTNGYASEINATKEDSLSELFMKYQDYKTDFKCFNDKFKILLLDVKGLRIKLDESRMKYREKKLAKSNFQNILNQIDTEIEVVNTKLETLLMEHPIINRSQYDDVFNNVSCNANIN